MLSQYSTIKHIMSNIVSPTEIYSYLHPQKHPRTHFSLCDDFKEKRLASTPSTLKHKTIIRHQKRNSETLKSNTIDVRSKCSSKVSCRSLRIQSIASPFTPSINPLHRYYNSKRTNDQRNKLLSPLFRKAKNSFITQRPTRLDYRIRNKTKLTLPHSPFFRNINFICTTKSKLNNSNVNLSTCTHFERKKQTYSPQAKPRFIRKMCNNVHNTVLKGFILFGKEQKICSFEDTPKSKASSVCKMLFKRIIKRRVMKEDNEKGWDSEIKDVNFADGNLAIQ